MFINNYALVEFFISEFRHLGKERTFGSLTIDELDALAKAFEEFATKQSASDNEPPF
jgi:hypothetical protein